MIAVTDMGIFHMHKALYMSVQTNVDMFISHFCHMQGEHDM